MADQKGRMRPAPHEKLQVCAPDGRYFARRLIVNYVHKKLSNSLTAHSY